ncbi:hypothetical protein BP5796_07703 [Coleophoma crateriformis]|uniref:Nephrocystin 3-like N-terminal domain-containing protein n=1 Tax=Coleophoma crateriformis TaxID=565419 RepID=A0A3D8RC90_9HELO|nr:hypothetical protein BP5796_07703 [Coleophoma crateriformis]
MPPKRKAESSDGTSREVAPESVRQPKRRRRRHKSNKASRVASGRGDSGGDPSRGSDNGGGDGQSTAVDAVIDREPLRNDELTKELLDYLFNALIRKLLQINSFSSNTAPSFFVVYAHDSIDEKNRKAGSDQVRQLIQWLEVVHSKIISDRSPLFRAWPRKSDGTQGNHDILANQFCLLPQGKQNSKGHLIGSVDKVILFCSELLEDYYGESKHGEMKAYTENLKTYYSTKKEEYLSGDAKTVRQVQKKIRGIANKYADESGFHHVLTELTFMELRFKPDFNKEIIPIVLSGKGMESLPIIKNKDKKFLIWMKPPEPDRTDWIFHETQVLHRLFFKLLLRLFDERQTLIKEFRSCYDDCAKILSQSSGRLLSQEEFGGIIEEQFAKTVRKVIDQEIASLQVVFSEKDCQIEVDGSELKVQPLAPSHSNISNVNQSNSTGNANVAGLKIEGDGNVNITGTIYKNHEKALNELPVANEALYTSQLWEFQPTCLQETRTELLEQIDRWASDPQSPFIFWLSGMAGTGKSTIARTVCRRFKEEKILGASFLFSRDKNDLRKPDKFVSTIAAQIAKTTPEIIPCLCDVIAKPPPILKQGLTEQWKDLIIQPLTNLKEASYLSKTIAVVIDALDECEDALDECEAGDQFNSISQLLTEMKAPKANRLRLFITSRPELAIRRGFDKMPKVSYHNLMLHSIPEEVVEHDISIYLRHELDQIREYKGLGSDWPSEETVQKLLQNSGRLFIYPATICRFLSKSTFPKRDLASILQSGTAHHRSSDSLDSMYALILENTISKVRDEDLKDVLQLFQQIIGSILVLSDTLSANALTDLLDISSHEMNPILEPLYSVLDIPPSKDQPLRIFHLSFRDFLSNGKRCRDSRFRFDERQAHAKVLAHCLNIMSSRLKKNVCHLPLPGTLVEEIETADVREQLAPAVQYACRNWVYHLQQSQIELADNTGVHIFLQKHFLHWLEALSLMRSMPSGVVMLKTLSSILAVYHIIPF